MIKIDKNERVVENEIFYGELNSQLFHKSEKVKTICKNTRKIPLKILENSK